MKRGIMMLSASGFVLALAMASWAQVKEHSRHVLSPLRAPWRRSIDCQARRDYQDAHSMSL